MPHESTVAHEYEQRLSKEDANPTATLETLGETAQNNVDDVSLKKFQ